MNNIEARAGFEAHLNRLYSDRSTPQHYLSDLAIFLEAVGQKAVHQIDSRDMDQFVTQQQRKGRSAATINRRLAALHTFFEWMATQEGESSRPNPVVWRRHAPKQGQRVARDASDAEVLALFEQIDDPRDQAIFGLTLTCHQLRHTFARRLADQNMPIESISKVLGHSQIETTQRYTAGANPTLKAEFEAAMAQLELAAEAEPEPTAFLHLPRPARQRYPADSTQLQKALARYTSFPDWLRTVLEAHLTDRWYRWKAHMAAHNAARTSEQVAAAWRWLLDAFHLSGWQTLSRAHIEAWMSALLDRGLKTSTVVRYHTHLASVLHFVQERDLAKLDPQLFRIQTPQTLLPLPRHLHEREYQQLLHAVLAETETMPAGLLHRTWFLTLAFTGIRLSELLDLRLSDLDLATGRLFIHAPKNQAGRVTFLTPSLRHHLQQYLAWRPPSPSDHLFVTKHGSPLSRDSIQYRCTQWGLSCNLQLSPHRLRHTFATRLINQGVSLESIRRLLGHRTLTMTQRYARLHESTIRQHFEDATAHIEGIPISDWPQHEHTHAAPIAKQSVNSM